MVLLSRSFATTLLVATLASCATEPTGPSTAAAPASPSTVQKSAPLEVVSAQFGVFGADHSGRRVLFETNHFPAIVAAPYGWYIIFKSDKPTVVWREEFELPIAPPTWGPGEAMGVFHISPDRRTAVTERVIPARIGFIANEWRYAPGDPIGAHAMRIYIDGQLIREFKFDIEDGPGARERSPGTPRTGASST
jgi:hypothetical protein